MPGALGLDEHLLAGLVGVVGRVDDHVRSLRLAVAGSRRVELAHADIAAAQCGQDDEEQPPEDGLARMLCAPPAGARSEIALGVQRDSLEEVGMTMRSLRRAASPLIGRTPGPVSLNPP